MGLGDAYGQALKPQPSDLVQILQRARSIFHRGRAVNAGGDDLDLFAHALLPVVQGFVVGRATVGRGRDQLGQLLGPLPALLPALHYGRLHAHELAVIENDLMLLVRVRGEAVDGHDGGEVEESHVLDLLGQILKASGQRLGVGHGQVRKLHPAVVFQRPNRGHQNHGAGVETCGLTLDIQKFFSAQIKSEARLGDHIVGEAEARAGGYDRIGALGDVGEGTAVHDGRVALQGLDEVGLDGVLQEGGHGALGVQVAGVDGFAAVCEAKEDVPQTSLQIRQIVGQAEDGHDLRGRGDVEAGLARDAVHEASQAADHAPKRAVVHVHDPFPGHGAAVEIERAALALQVVVDESRQEVVGLLDGREISREVEVYVFHG